LEPNLNSLRTFIGSKDFKTSKAFYKDLGFQEAEISEKMSLFTNNKVSFYLQDYFVEEWLSNSMLFAEVDSVEEYWDFLVNLKLDEKYSGVKLIPIQENEWGKECLLIDPSGVLWHFAKFN
jgi:catechol 2,3-dioxygenase-like lactoylglutathione lyase family enzyme